MWQWNAMDLHLSWRIILRSIFVDSPGVYQFRCWVADRLLAAEGTKRSKSWYVVHQFVSGASRARHTCIPFAHMDVFVFSCRHRCVYIYYICMWIYIIYTHAYTYAIYYIYILFVCLFIYLLFADRHDMPMQVMRSYKRSSDSGCWGMATYLLAVLGTAVMTNQLILLQRGTGWVSEGQSWAVLAMFAGTVTCLHSWLLVSCWRWGRMCLNEGQQL